MSGIYETRSFFPRVGPTRHNGLHIKQRDFLNAVAGPQEREEYNENESPGDGFSKVYFLDRPQGKLKVHMGTLLSTQIGGFIFMTACKIFARPLYLLELV